MAYKYLFPFSAVVDNNVIVTADSYDEARAEYRRLVSTATALLRHAVKSMTDWDYDGNYNDEGEFAHPVYCTNPTCDSCRECHLFVDGQDCHGNDPDTINPYK